MKAVKGFAGKSITLPGHPVSTKDAFNSLELKNGTTDTLSVTAANQAADEYSLLKIS